MSTVPDILVFPRTPKQWLNITPFIIAIAFVAHFSITGLKALIGAGDADKAWYVLLIVSHIYTTFIVLAQLLSGEIANKRLPLNSRSSILSHIGIQAVSAVVGFVIAQQVERLIWGFCTIPNGMMSIVVGVTFVLSIICNAAYYISLFYRRAKESEQLMLIAELAALRAQINPHFLFNTLNSIVALIRSNPDEAEAVTEHLAELFRYSLRASKTPYVLLEEELHSVQTYLAVERCRFPDRLQVSYDIDRRLLTSAVPSLILQPLVENAIKHGANKIEGNFTIHISCSEHKGIMVLRVEDSGFGFELSEGENIFNRGSGLANVRDRLLLIYPQNSAVRIEKNAVVLMFPYTLQMPKILKNASSGISHSN